MKLFPFYDVAENAEEKMHQGWTIFQQWQCAHCKAKQTMADPNHFYMRGICEECSKETDIREDGCNFMAVGGVLGDKVIDIIQDIEKKAQ